ncbi:hypothetical protein CRYUN_Cryun31cG0109500 [Craigia yunnanensis]
MTSSSNSLETMTTNFRLMHMDEVIDELLTRDYSCNIPLPRVKKRLSNLTEEEEEEENEQDGLEDEPVHEKDYYRARSPTRERERERERWKTHCYRYRYQDYERERETMIEIEAMIGN